VLACRDVEKGEAAADRIRAELPGARSRVASLDLSSLQSVRQFASGLDFGEIGLLINNAGIMMTPLVGPPMVSSSSSGRTTWATSR